MIHGHGDNIKVTLRDDLVLAAAVLAARDEEGFRQRLIDAGYRNVSEVSEAGELAWRGGIIDLFPSGSVRC